jgi:cytochrome c5
MMMDIDAVASDFEELGSDALPPKKKPAAKAVAAKKAPVKKAPAKGRGKKIVEVRYYQCNYTLRDAFNSPTCCAERIRLGR